MEGTVREADGVFSIASMRSHHLMEGGHAIAGLELDDVGADGMHDASNVISLVQRLGSDLWPLPILWI